MTEIEKIRSKIDQIDQKISDLLKERLVYVKKIGEIKKKNGFPITNEQREQDIIQRLETEYEREIFKKIIQESRKKQ